MRAILITFFTAASLFTGPCIGTAAAQDQQGLPAPVPDVTADPLPDMQMPPIPTAADGVSGIHQIHVLPQPQREQKIMPGPENEQNVMGQKVMDPPNSNWDIQSKSAPPANAATDTDTNADMADTKAPVDTHTANTKTPDVSPAALKADFSSLRQADTSVVDQIIDPLRLRLRDGRIVQLSNIAIPDYDPYDPGPVTVQAAAFIEGLLKGKQVRLFVTKNSGQGRSNRMGYLLAQVERNEGGVWVQGALLAAGLAEVLPSRHNTEMAAAMTALEAQARQARRGLWADGTVAILDPDNAGKGVGKLAIVQGTVHGTATVSNMIYLNFGQDWRTDFTIGISTDVRRAMNKNGIDPLNLGGKTVRVRGWLESYNGPFITLDDPAWLEIVPSDSDKAP